MRQEPASEYLTVTLTKQEKELLHRLAYEQGATMRGYVRKLIRDAGSRLEIGVDGSRADKHGSTYQDSEMEESYDRSR